MSWRAAESVKVLVAEVNALFPGRDKRTDGVISGYPGSVSSHQVNSAGVVCAVDITVGDYANGITPAQAAVLAESIRHELKVAPRGIYAYIIYDRRMARSTHDWEWEPYKGTSPHTDHIHVSVDWDIPEGGKPSGECPYDMTDSWNLRGPSMVATTLPTSRPVTQDWNQDFNYLNGRYYPNGFYASIGWFGHNGIDFGCWEGDPVEAVCDGVIDFAGPGNNHPLLTGGGNAILLRNDALGVKFEYLHLSRFEVSHGQHVKVGQVIARSGNTGISSAPHLHIGAIPIHGVNVNNGYRGRIDPTPYLYGPMNPEFAGGAAIGPAGTITKPEGFLMALNDEAQDNIYKAMGRVDPAVAEIKKVLGDLTGEVAKISARVFGRDVQRWYHPDNPGDVRTYWFEGSVAARSTDVNDVLSTNRLIEANTNKVLTALSQIPGVDAGVVAGLREQLAAELKEATDNLSVTLVVKDGK